MFVGSLFLPIFSQCLISHHNFCKIFSQCLISHYFFCKIFENLFLLGLNRQMSLHNYKNIDKLLNLNIENGPTLLYIKRTLFELSLKIFVTSHVSKI